MFWGGKERYALRESDIQDVAAKMSFKVDHGFSAFENGRGVDCSVVDGEASLEDIDRGEQKTRAHRHR